MVPRRSKMSIGIKESSDQPSTTSGKQRNGPWCCHVICNKNPTAFMHPIRACMQFLEICTHCLILPLKSLWYWAEVAISFVSFHRRIFSLSSNYDDCKINYTPSARWGPTVGSSGLSPLSLLRSLYLQILLSSTAPKLWKASTVMSIDLAMQFLCRIESTGIQKPF